MRTKIDGTKYIFVTGGVVSSLGKGIVASSLGRLLKERGYKVTIQKFDPRKYLGPAKNYMKNYYKEKIRDVFGAEGAYKKGTERK